MSETPERLILPEDDIRTGFYRNGDLYWSGRFSDGTICATATRKGRNDNTVIFNPAGAEVPELPSKPLSLKAQDIFEAILEATSVKHPDYDIEEMISKMDLKHLY